MKKQLQRIALILFAVVVVLMALAEMWKPLIVAALVVCVVGLVFALRGFFDLVTLVVGIVRLFSAFRGDKSE